VRLLVATTNAGKIREIRAVLEGAPIQLITLDGWPSLEAPEEIGRTFQENSRHKALYYAAATGETTVAEDSGLEIDALDGLPGVESARYGGARTPYPEKFELIEAALRARSAPSPGSATDHGTSAESDRSARFVCALTLARGLNILFETRGVIEGRIVLPPRGTGGFGYDPIFFYPPYGCTLAEVTAAQKTAVSHRGQAFRALKTFLLETDRRGATGVRDR
jgi:XTP/dITP diphosphohydrolase